MRAAERAYAKRETAERSTCVTVRAKARVRLRTSTCACGRRASRRQGEAWSEGEASHQHVRLAVGEHLDVGERVERDRGAGERT